MENDSTTDAADNQSDQQDADNQSDQGKATTDQQTDTDKGADNLEKSDSTDNSGEDDNSNSNEGKDDNSSASTFDDDLDEWAKKTNRAVPTTDSERKLLQEIRDGQREFSREQEAKKATAAVQDAMKNSKPADNKQDDEAGDDDDPLAKEVADLKRSNREEKTARLQSEYFTTHPVTPEESKVMGEILKEKIDKGGQAAYDYWTNPDNLEDWHTLAKARIGSTTDTTAIETEAARKERVRIAKEQQANGPARNATSKVTTDKKGYNRTEFLKAD